MQRLIIRSLEQWKQKQNRKLLIIQGARQVGKTWIIIQHLNIVRIF